MSTAALPGSSALRPRSGAGILTPGSSASPMNKKRDDAVLSSEIRKGRSDETLSSEPHNRNRDSQSLPMEELLRPIIYVKPQLSVSPSVKPCILRPLMLLPREHLSLSSLDLSAPSGEFTTGPGRFFESQIKILDFEARMGCSVLLARSDATRNMYAVERHQNGLYVLCKLGTWVDVEKLSMLATVYCKQRISPAAGVQANNSAPPRTTPQMHKQDKKKRLAIEEIQSMVRKRPRALSMTPFESQPSQSFALIHPLAENTLVSQYTTQEESTPTSSTAQPPRASQIDMQQTAEDIFQVIRDQYTEALYHSMGSLAYFAKGSLSRARAAFHLDCDANLEMKDLIDFLKSLVKTAAQIDKKHRETIPQLIKDMNTMVDSSDDGEPKAKRRKTKKMKLGKDGLYPGEIDHVKKWWNVHKPDLKDDYASGVNAQEIQYHISSLRTRETQLQMIIILEILALELMRPAEDTQDSQLPGMPVEAPAKVLATEAVPKKRNKHNLPVLIDVHADRMCIWQSTTLDEMKMVADFQRLKNGNETQKSDRVNSDPLKDFCIDIILPFFAARLPELCEGLNRKFGGPVVVSPPKPKKPQSSMTAQVPLKPGAATKRPAAANAPRTLQRALSSDQHKRRATRRPNDVLARMRSATPAAIPGVKREASEPLSVDSIPKDEKRYLKERSRNVLSKSNSSASMEDLKAKKKAQMEAELADAISTLKKPNRQAVGKGIVEEAEKRTVVGSSHPRKSRKPVRHLLNNVQVKATPANNRYKDALATETKSFSSLSLPFPRTDSDAGPSSSIIPSTAPRNGLRDDLAAFHIASTPIADKVKATPARVPAVPKYQSKPDLWAGEIPNSSPLCARKPRPITRAPDNLLDPGTATRRTEMPPSSPGLRHLFETPIKRKSTATMRDVLDSSPPAHPLQSPVLPQPFFAAPAPAPALLVPAPAESKPPRSIYQQLGWDDDEDELA